MTDSSRRFAEEIYRIEQLALGHATSPQLGQSRMDGGILEWGDEDGNVIGRIGPDGSGSLDIEYIEGPKPPRPSTPVVTSDAGFVRVRWDGDWASNEEPEAIADPDVMATADADRVEIHLSLDENFVPDQVQSFAGTLPVVDGGGDSAIGPLTESGTYWCVLMARSKAGKYSEPSERVAVEVSTVNLESELFGLALKADEAMESADGKNSVYYGNEEPKPKPVTDEDGNPVLDEDGNPIYTEFRDGDIWFGEGNLPHIWSEESGEWVPARDSRLDELQDAIDNIEVDFDTDSVLAEARDEAQRLADQARDAAIAADATTFWLPEEVAGYEPQHWGEYAPQNPKEGDLALVPNLPGLGGGFISYRYRSGAWVEASDAIAKAAMEFAGSALSTADEAQQTANGKNKITRSLDNPPVVYTGAVNDLWWRLSSMGSGGRVISQWRWNGSVWVSELVGDETIANLNAAKITAGYLDAARIQAQSISVDKLIVSSNANLLSDPQFASGGAGWAGALNGPIGPNAEFTTVPDGPGGVFAPVARITVPSNDFTAFYSKSWPQFPENGSDPLQGMKGTEVRPGESYRFVLRARVVQRPTTGVGGLRLRGGFSLNGGSRQWPLLTGNLLTDAPLGEWRDVTGVWAHDRPNEARNRLSVGIHAVSSAGAIFEVAFVGMYAMTTSELIVDGAVTARTVSAGAIGATAIAAEAIEGRHVKAGSLLADAVLVPGSVGGTLIADGAVTTNHLKAGSITAESGIIGSLDAGVITTGELRGELIRAGSIAGRALAADAIDGKTITGATIRTAAAGARVEMNNQGLTQYNDFGQPILQMVDGSLSAVGKLYSGVSGGSSVQIDSSLWAGGVFVPTPDGPESEALGAGVRIGVDERAGMDLFYGRYHNPNGGGYWGSAGVIKGPTGTEGQQSGSYYTDSGITWTRGVAGNRKVDVQIDPASNSGNSGWQAVSYVDGRLRAATSAYIYEPTAGVHRGFVQSRALGTSNSIDVSERGECETLATIGGTSTGDSGGFSIRSYLEGSLRTQVFSTLRTISMQAGPAFVTAERARYFDTYSASLGVNSSNISVGSEHVTATSQGGITLRASATGQINLTGAGADLTLGADSTSSFLLSKATYNRAHGSSVPLVRITSNGVLGRDSSARKYKTDERVESPDEYADALLSLPFKSWVDKNEKRLSEELAQFREDNPMCPTPPRLMEAPDEPCRAYGAVADDFAAAGLDPFVFRGPDGDIEGLHYELIGMALVPIVREQRDRIQALEKELEQIKELINA